MSLANDTIRHELSHLNELSRGTRAYFQARTRNRLYDLVMSKFREKKNSEGLTQAELARRMGKRPEVVNRMLSTPGNWGTDTISDLLLAIAGEELDASSTSPSLRPPTNRRHLDRDDENRFRTSAKTEGHEKRYTRIEKTELDDRFVFS